MDGYNNLSEEEKKSYDVSQLGEGIELIGYDDNNENVDLTQALTPTSYKFDGVDDYIKINFNDEEKKKQLIENGFTFEYYGKLNEGKCYDDENREVTKNYIGICCLWGDNYDTKDFPLRFGVEVGENSLNWSPCVRLLGRD